jgi:hypothetical protein
MQEKYSYSAEPHAAPVKRKPKYREGGESEDAERANEIQNIMYDSRVVRGNTYAPKIMTSSLKNELNASSRKAPRKENRAPGKTRAGTPPPVDGRSHMVMQTDDFLEELTDKPVEQDAETQTQPFMDRPASPLFVRAKVGFDTATQIENGDLFDFDLEVEPLLEVLVGKTIHVSMLEIMQEEELEAIRLQQQEFETIRNIELAEVQRLEAEIKRKAQEKNRRIAQEQKRLADRRKLEQTIAARAFSNQFLGELHINVFDELEQKGHFYDPVQREVEDVFMTGMLQQLLTSTSSYAAASEIAAELLEAARAKAKAFEKQAIRNREELKARLAKEEAERKAQEAERLALEAAARAAAEAAGEEAPAEE